MKVKSPIFSDGRGKLGENVVGSMWKGRWYLRSYVVPANPKTLAQKAHRAVMLKAVADAQGILATPANKTEWNRAALPDSISGYNLLVKDYVGSPIKPDNYSAAAVTKFSGENLSIPRGELRIGVDKAGAMDVYTPVTIGGVAPAWEVTKANMVGYVTAAGDKIYVLDNRVFPNSVVEAERDAKATSHYYPNEATGNADECVLAA